MSETTVQAPLDTEELSAFQQACQGERASIWWQGQIVAKVRRDAGKDARAALGVLAQVGGCTIASLVQKADVHEAFEPGQRNPDKPWSWHRSARRAAIRLGVDIPTMCQRAQTEDLGQRELDGLGKAAKPVSLRATCGDCGARVSVTMPGVHQQGMKGLQVGCPVCAAQERDDQGDRGAHLLGALG